MAKDETYCSAIYKHPCGHFVMWAVPQPPAHMMKVAGGDKIGFLAAYARMYAQPFSIYPCPWCGGETGKPVVPEDTKVFRFSHFLIEQLEEDDDRIGKIQ